MERECFEDDDVAEMMNSSFVNIKVDKEERPDVDSLYMKACQLMTGSGGWPLTIVMTPDKEPFYAATFIPRSSRGGMPGLLDLIPAIDSTWKERRKDINEVTARIKDALITMQLDRPISDLATMEESTVKDLRENFDGIDGGFGQAPKFPMPHKAMFLLRRWRKENDRNCLDMAERTLIKMALGGVHDHVGGGFHRYSTDGSWSVPHFEKMLCDQAMISMTCTEAYLSTGRALLKEAALGTFSYVLRELSDPDGGFYTSEDADNQDGEGAFYTWSYEEFAEAVNKNDLPIVADIFDVRKAGNYQIEPGRLSGRNVLHMVRSIDEYASAKKIPAESIHEMVSKAKKSLFRSREKRSRPGLDDKVLLDWNGLIIAALAKGGRGFGQPNYIERAERAVQFIESRMKNDDESLFHRYRDREAGIGGMLTDYAYYSWGLIELYFATMEPRYLKLAEGYVEKMNSAFMAESGGFWSSVNKDLIAREMDVYDGSIPSGNSVAIYVNMALGELKKDDRFIKAAKAAAEHFSAAALKNPSAHCFYAIGVQMLTGGISVVTMRKDPRGLADEEIRGAVDSSFAPDVFMTVGDVDNDDRAIAQVCRSNVCLPSVRDIETLKKQLRI